MKTKISLCALVLLSVLPPAATDAATIVQQFSTGKYTAPGAELKWEPISPPFLDDAGTIVDKEVFTTPLRNGLLSNQIYAGWYRVTFGPTAAEIWRIKVPTNDVTISFWECYALASNAVPSIGSVGPTIFELSANKGQANGYASLDAGAKVPLAQLPSGIGGGTGISTNGGSGTNNTFTGSTNHTATFQASDYEVTTPPMLNAVDPDGFPLLTVTAPGAVSFFGANPGNDYGSVWFASGTSLFFEGSTPGVDEASISGNNSLDCRAKNEVLVITPNGLFFITTPGIASIYSPKFGVVAFSDWNRQPTTPFAVTNWIFARWATNGHGDITNSQFLEEAGDDALGTLAIRSMATDGTNSRVLTFGVGLVPSITVSNDGVTHLSSNLVVPSLTLNGDTRNAWPTGGGSDVAGMTFLTNWANAVSNLTTAVTNSASVTNWINGRQPASANVTNWSNIPTGAMANVVATDFLTNWANAVSNLAQTKQLGSANLTNWSNIPTGSMANVVATDFLTNWANAVSNLTTVVTNSASVTNWINSRQPASANLTNWSNIPTGAMANVVATDFLTNWANAVSNLAQTKQLGSANLTNWSNIPTGAMANVVAANFLTNWANAVSNLTTVVTNSASVTNWINSRQPASDNLTNWSNIPTGAMANAVSATFLTNWANSVSNLTQTKQAGTAMLTNISGSGALTNANLTNVYLIASVTSTQIDASLSHRWIQTNAMAGDETYALTNYGVGDEIHLVLPNDTSGGATHTATFTVQSGDLISIDGSTLATGASLIITNPQIAEVSCLVTKYDRTNVLRLLSGAASGSAGNAALFQPANQKLTNGVNTGFLTNLVNNATNGSGWIGLVGPTNNGDVRIKGLSTNGLGVVATDNGTNVNLALSTQLQNVHQGSIGAGSGTSNAFIGGVLFKSTTSFTNLNGAGTMSNLCTFTLPAHTLTNNLDSAIGEWRVVMPAAAPNTNQFQIVFGSTTVLDTGLQIASNTVVLAKCEITRTGNTSQHVDATLIWGPGMNTTNGAGVPWAYTNVNLEIAETCGVATAWSLKGGARRVGAHTNNFSKFLYEPSTTPDL